MAYLYMFKQLWRYAKPERWKVVVYFLFHAIATLGDLGKPFAFAMVVNALQAQQSSMLIDIMHWLVFYIMCFFVFEVFHISARYIERYVAFRNRKRFVGAMYDHLQALPLSWHADNHSGAVIDRVNRASDALFHFGEHQCNYIAVFMKFWGPLIILWQISPTVSLVSVLVGFIMVGVTRKLYNLSVPEYRAQNEGFHKVAATLHDYVSNIRTIVTLRLGQCAKKDILNRLELVFPHIVKENNVTHLKCFISAFLVLLVEVGLIFYYIVEQNRAGAIIMIGSVTAIFQYLGQLMTSFQFYAGEYESIIHWRTDFEAIKPVLDEKITYKLRETRLDKWDNIQIQPMSFVYGNGEFQLQNISVNLAQNKKIALVGESGAGKSTVLHILRGLTALPDATVEIDGEAIFPISFLADISTLIPQEPEIFENTIRYNVTMGISATEEEVESAISTAGFSDIVNRLPKGLDSDVREKGVNLSGGEKQRLALARGIFSIQDSSLILLDEPTGSVDPATEMMIFKTLFELLSGRCVVSVLHRLHLVRLFDYVYVMKQGKIVEEGTFDNICNARGEFSRLWDKYLAEDDNDHIE